MRFKRQKHPCLELLGVACRVSFDLLGWIRTGDYILRWNLLGAVPTHHWVSGARCLSGLVQNSHNKQPILIGTTYE